jgi:hypothetical protein
MSCVKDGWSTNNSRTQEITPTGGERTQRLKEITQNLLDKLIENTQISITAAGDHRG